MTDSYTDRLAKECLAERERLVASIQQVLSEIQNIDKVLRALGVEPPTGLPEGVAPVAVTPGVTTPPPPPVERIPVQGPEDVPDITPEVADAPIPPAPIDEGRVEHRQGREAREQGRVWPSRKLLVDTLAKHEELSTYQLLQAIRESNPSINTLGDGVRNAIRDGWIEKLDEKDGRGFPFVRVTDKAHSEQIREVKPPAQPAPKVAKEWEPTDQALDVLSDLNELGGEALGNVVAAHMEGDANVPPTKRGIEMVGRNLRKLEEHGYVEQTGTAFAPWQKAKRDAGDRYVGGGRPSVRYRMTAKGRELVDGEGEQEVERATEVEPAPPPEQQSPEPEVAGLLPSTEPRLEEVRDIATDQPSLMFSPAQLLREYEKEWDLAITKLRLDQLVSQGILTDESPAPDLAIYRYERPTSPGKAAEMQQRQAEAASTDVSDPVAGTGRGDVPTNKEVRQLVELVKRAGAKVERAGNSHYRIKYKGRSTNISSTPSNPRSVENDRTRLRRIGLVV